MSFSQTDIQSSEHTLQHAEPPKFDELDIIGNTTPVSNGDFTFFKQCEPYKYLNTSNFGSESDQGNITQDDEPRSDGTLQSLENECMNMSSPRNGVEINHTAWSPNDILFSPVKLTDVFKKFDQNGSSISTHTSQLRHVETVTRTVLESMVINQDDWQKQEHGCLSLNLIMKEQWFAAHVISCRDGAKHVIVAMTLFQDFLQVQKAGIETLFFLTSDDAGRISTIEERGIEHVIWAMRQFVEDRELVMNGSSYLCNISHCNESAKKRVGKLGGIDVVVDVMNEHQHDCEIQIKCCLALRKFTAKVHANQWAAGRVCAMEAIVHGIENFPDELNLHSNGCVAIANMCENEAQNRERAAMTGAIEKVIGVIQSCLDNVTVATNCLIAIRNITKQNERNQELVRNLGGLRAVLQCLRLHKTCADVLENGCEAIRFLLFSPRNRVSFCECGGIETLIRILGEQYRNSHVAYAILLALGNAIFNTPLSKMKVLEYGGIEKLLATMQYHLQSTDIQEHICRAFRNLADFDENSILLLVSRPTIDVLSSMSMHPTNASILEHGLAFLYNMSKCTVAISRMRDLPIVLTLENILEQNPNNPRIQVQITALLQKLKAPTLADVAAERNRFSNRKKLCSWVFSFSSILAPYDVMTRRASGEQVWNLSKRSSRINEKRFANE